MQKFITHISKMLKSGDLRLFTKQVTTHQIPSTRYFTWWCKDGPILSYNADDGVKNLVHGNIEMTHITTCQIDENLLFQMDVFCQNFRLLRRTALGNFSVESVIAPNCESNLENELYAPSLCMVKSKFIFLIGGFKEKPSLRYLRQCHRYDVKKNKWQIMRKLNVGRCYFSSCYLGQKIYVFCGTNSGGEINSIEKLEITVDSTVQKNEKWKEIPPSQLSALAHYSHILASPLCDKEIVIFGGLQNPGDRVFIFDTTTEECT